ncbi:phage major tail tube protein [Selenomonas bovis]|jgi:P2 family phage contractile tail tube protein|uniref:phage major tail tube protein n=1 Tax=Selenomonas bovis TaxID=416586 RepID=UPI0004E0E164|nr:phage major tail tube protein [Selenomonas bovis]
MSTVNLIQDKSITYEVFKDGDRKLGTTEIALPSLEPKTSTLSGAGIGGEIEMPTPGQLGSTEVELTWRTITGNNTELMGMDAQDLELRNANETYDAGTGKIGVDAIKINLRGFFKKGDLGSLKPSDHTDTKTTLEVIYIKVSINGERKIEIDKLNYIHYVDGKDYMAAVRSALGL